MCQKNKLILALAFVLCLLFSAVPGLAQTVTWTGSIDDDWHKLGNWSSGSVPGAGATVQIRPQGGNPYPVISQDVTISTLTLSLWYSGDDVTPQMVLH